uniref:FAM65 N-terminal domain-containing protein n=1 Tax=Astatotilapia calliptera TaxID=8154 RepID=A0AAX7V142_ASTCA
MSVKLRFDSPSDGGLIHRSRSFTGFSSLTGRQRTSSVRNSLRVKAMTGNKASRAPVSPRRSSGAIWSLQPEQVGRVFQALRKGLKDYLEGHQAEMDFLSSQQRETKRNSRLAFLYDLEKEIRSLERYIRRLEFQISKVEELYETYCIQWRLCQGAVNMKRAFSLSQSTRASRESLLELNRNHRHSLQDMSTMEGELEILLGELHIKMKGLIGFARLCPGDQYEVLVRLGRQRWKIRGRIESDDSQSWDEEEMVFLPHIHHNFEIKVTEAKGLSWLLVGMVTCASADFFVARPQVMLVDITELGTIKLQLEVTWNPFDGTEKLRPLSGNKQSVSSRKSSVYSWTAPSTPSFTEKYFIVRMCAHTCTHSGVLLMQSTCTGSRIQHQPFHSVLFLFPDSTDCEEYSVTALPTPPSQTPAAPQTSPAAAAPRLAVSGVQRHAQALRLGAIIAELEKILQDQSCADKELRALEHQILHLATILKNDLSLLRSSSSEETLAVEEVLGSFDFLSNDLNGDDDASCLGSLRLKDSGISSFQQSTLRSHGILSQGSQSASEEELVITPLTSGNWGLDQALETHLDICCILLQVQNLHFIFRYEMSLQAEWKIFLPKAQRTRGLLLFWEECVHDNSSPFCCHIDSFTKTLKKRYTHKVKAKQPGQSEKVFSQLLQQVQAACRVVPSSRSVCSPERVTLFQLSVYLKRWNFQELGEHISRLSKEEYILSALSSPKRRRALNKLRGRKITELLPLGCTLQTLASLQIDSNHKVCKAATNCISRAAGCKAFRNKAVLYYTESLKSNYIKIQQSSCLALKCLRATESVDHIADLWRSTDEDLRSAARETVLSFGKKGYQAYQRMDQLDTEMQDEAYQNQETEITIF